MRFAFSQLYGAVLVNFLGQTFTACAAWHANFGTHIVNCKATNHSAADYKHRILVYLVIYDSWKVSREHPLLLWANQP